MRLRAGMRAMRSAPITGAATPGEVSDTWVAGGWLDVAGGAAGIAQLG